MNRSSGILMPIFSLPSPYGIGTLGKAAYDFADFLAEAGQHYWQMLPLGPTSYGDSPYQSFSTFAGNPYFIDPDLLVEDGLLTKQEVKAYRWGSDPRHVDYGAVYNSRLKLLSKAKKRGWERPGGGHGLCGGERPVVAGLRPVHGLQAPFRDALLDGVGG